MTETTAATTFEEVIELLNRAEAGGIPSVLPDPGGFYALRAEALAILEQLHEMEGE